MAAAAYIWENPVRAGLVAQWRQYPYLGAVVAGYPDPDPRRDDFWDVFWRIYAARCGENLTTFATRDRRETGSQGEPAKI